MGSFQTHYERLELKYLLDEGQAERVRRDLGPYCTRDVHAKEHTGPLPGYPIRSLYLDSPALEFHRAKERGDPVRMKLRIRRYEGFEGACMELKRRSGDIIGKSRALVHTRDLRSAAYGSAVGLRGRSDTERTLREFSSTALRFGAQPTLLVDYTRDAYQSEVDHYARVTFDRGISFQRTQLWDLERTEGHWLQLDEHVQPTVRPVTVLELKCTTAVPKWLAQLIQDHQLRRSSISKYSIGIYTTLRTEAFIRGQERARGILR